MTDLISFELVPCKQCRGTGWEDCIRRGDGIYGHPRLCTACKGRASIEKQRPAVPCEIHIDTESYELRPYQQEMIAKLLDTHFTVTGTITVSDWDDTVFDWFYATGKKRHYLVREMKRTQYGLRGVS